VIEKVIRVPKKLVDKRARLHKDITSEYRSKLRMNRSIQVVRAFGILIYDQITFSHVEEQGKNRIYFT